MCVYTITYIQSDTKTAQYVLKMMINQHQFYRTELEETPGLSWLTSGEADGWVTTHQAVLVEIIDYSVNKTVCNSLIRAGLYNFSRLDMYQVHGVHSVARQRYLPHP